MELVRKELFQYFMDVCHSFEARLLNRIFLAKAKELYDAYRDTMEENGEIPEEIIFSRQWLKGWCRQYTFYLNIQTEDYNCEKTTRKITSWISLRTY